MEVADLLHLSSRFNPDGTPTRGVWPIPRFPSGSTTRMGPVSKVPTGLPVNCYDSAWLNSLHPEERLALDIRPPVDLTISDRLRR